MAAAGYVYLARAGDLYKIGSSLDPEERVKQLPKRHGTPELMHAIATDDRFALERIIQGRFAGERAGGEWFLLAASSVELFCSLAACEMNALPGWLTGVVPAKVQEVADERYRTGPKAREGHRYVWLELPDDVYEAVAQVADVNGRSVKEEVAHAAQRHITAPPTVRIIIDTPPLPPAEVAVDPGKKPRGRPRKRKEGWPGGRY